MAVTITRTPWVDDDGTGTTGTVINNAVKTALYNEIDTALAKVAQLAGGNAFTGNQAITGGNLTVAGAGPHTFSTNAVERMRIAATGEVLINTTTTASPHLGLLKINADLGVAQGISLLNTNPSNSGNFIYFLNSANVNCGAIGQASPTSVTYGTTSDARLKTDAGRASDLASLRAVVVHDFTWADGGRDRGVFAQEAHPLYPRAVVAGTDEITAGGQLARPWLTDYSKFVPDLIVGFQQHDAEIAELRALLAPVSGR